MSDRLRAAQERYKSMTPLELLQYRADCMNEAEGDRHLEDGYTCTKCKNRGVVAEVKQAANGQDHIVFADCKCVPVRSSILKMSRSGLGDVIREKTFDKYIATEPWQQTIKEGAMEYAKAASGWFFLGGQSGAGKSHLGTAICREHLLQGRAVAYMVWPDEAPIIKAAARADGEDYNRREKMLERLKQADILYIDDLFKPDKDSQKVKQRPTGADIRLAFEILNYRSNNPKLLTIISSEFTTDELVQIDEATGGRIIEKSVVFNISEDMSRNYRLRKAVTV